jgi:hypothetical protein
VPALGVTGAAYTDNDVEAVTATTLFDLDTVLNRVAPVPGQRRHAGPTGTRPADIGPDAGFDIYSSLTDGVTDGNAAFASVEVDGERRLWAVDVLTGSAADLGEFGAEVTDLAVELDQ